MSDIERIMSEAEAAQAEAEAAARRAEALAAQAEQARRRAFEEQEARRRGWAQQVVDAYDADLAAAEQSIQEASDRFATVAVEDPAAAIEAYLAWAEAAIRHYTLQVRVAAVAPVLNLEASEPVHLAPPPFSQALDEAIARRVGELSTRARDEAAAEIHAHLDTAADEVVVPGTAPMPAAGQAPSLLN